jgi:hypothetical protein
VAKDAARNPFNCVNWALNFALCRSSKVDAIFGHRCQKCGEIAMNDSRLPGIDPKVSGCFPDIGVWSMGVNPAGAPDETEQAGRENALWALN